MSIIAETVPGFAWAQRDRENRKLGDLAAVWAGGMLAKRRKR
jgi:hypothetical protein